MLVSNSSGSQTDEISLKELVLEIREISKVFARKWNVLVFSGIVGIALAAIYVYIREPIYTAKCTFVLEEQGGGGALGQYAGIASMMGIDVGGGNIGIFQGDNIIELYKSRTMIQKTLLSKGPKSKDILINKYINHKNLLEKWSDNPKLRNLSFDVPLHEFSLQHDSIIGEIVDDINEKYLTVTKPDKKLNIVEVSVKSGDEIFAKEFAELIVENVNSFYIRTKTHKALENMKILERQADSVRRVLNAYIGGAARAIDANPNSNPAMQVLKVPSQRNQVDIQASSAIYAEVVKNLEISKISLRQETPLIQVIDKPVFPLKKYKTSYTKATILGCLFAVVLTTFYLLLRLIFSRLMR